MIIWTTVTKTFRLVIFILLFTITKETNYILCFDNIMHNCKQLNILMTGICKGMANYPFLWKLQCLMFFQLIKFVKIFSSKIIQVTLLSYSYLSFAFPEAKRINVLGFAKNFTYKIASMSCGYQIRKSTSNISVHRHNFLIRQIYWQSKSKCVMVRFLQASLGFDVFNT